MKTGALQKTQERLTTKQSEVGELESEVLRLKAQAGDTDTLAVIKRELSEQVSHIRRLESTNREQSMELKNFRRLHKAVEVVEEEKRALETKISLADDLQRELVEAQIQRQILEDEKKAWTSYLQSQSESDGQVEFDSPEDLARALIKGRLETASLVDRLGAIQPELLEKDEVIKSLEEERNKYRADVEKMRASNGGGSGADSRVKARLERQRTLAIKEVDYLREQLRTFDSEEITYTENKFDEQKRKRIQDLETLVDQYRTELQTLNSDLTKREEESQAPPPPSTSSLKRSLEDPSQDSAMLGQLSRKNRSLQNSLTTLQTTNAQLTSDLNATKSHLSSLRSSHQTRILALRSNPTSDHEAIKLSDISILRRENSALLARLLQSLQSRHQHLTDTLASSEKRQLRLKQIWTLKSQEFRQAVLSLLGWQIDFQPNGRFRMT
ncbi:MAG: hypothetical protein Q9190_007864, partial [Brigantiaea leucoxantha]